MLTLPEIGFILAFVLPPAAVVICAVALVFSPRRPQAVTRSPTAAQQHVAAH